MVLAITLPKSAKYTQTYTLPAFFSHVVIICLFQFLWSSTYLLFVCPFPQVKWSRENYHHSLSSPYSLRLASADAAGKIIVWDVVSGTAHCEIQEHAKPIQGESCTAQQDTSYLSS